MLQEITILKDLTEKDAEEIEQELAKAGIVADVQPMQVDTME